VPRSSRSAKDLTADPSEVLERVRSIAALSDLQAEPISPPGRVCSVYIAPGLLRRPPCGTKPSSPPASPPREAEPSRTFDDVTEFAEWFDTLLSTSTFFAPRRDCGRAGRTERRTLALAVSRPKPPQHASGRPTKWDRLQAAGPEDHRWARPGGLTITSGIHRTKPTADRGPPASVSPLGGTLSRPRESGAPASTKRTRFECAPLPNAGPREAKRGENKRTSRVPCRRPAWHRRILGQGRSGQPPPARAPRSRKNR